MVVLEGDSMISIGNNQYLQPDFLSPVLPTVGFFLKKKIFFAQIIFFKIIFTNFIYYFKFLDGFKK